MSDMADGLALMFQDMSDQLILWREIRVEDDAELVAFNPVRFQLPQRMYADHVVWNIQINEALHAYFERIGRCIGVDIPIQKAAFRAF